MRGPPTNEEELTGAHTKRQGGRRCELVREAGARARTVSRKDSWEVEPPRRGTKESESSGLNYAVAGVSEYWHNEQIPSADRSR